LNIFLGLISGSSIDSIRIIHNTTRWLRGRSSETFWDDFQDSREWDEDDARRSQITQYTPGEWNVPRYSLPMEIRVRLGISWLRIQNLPEAMVFPSKTRLIVETIPCSGES
jgi:general transcription factor 3C polypeptide 3 (transcription factor C subunit 4)